MDKFKEIDANLSLVEEILIKSIGINPDDLLWYATCAIWYGYSVESFAAFITRVRGLNLGVPEHLLPSSEGTPFEGTGFIPSEEEKGDPEITIHDIAKRRLCPSPFPNEEVIEDLEVFYDQLFSDVTSPMFLSLGKYLKIVR